MNQSRPSTHRLFIASCLTLFAELSVIRWLSTEVRIFSYAPRALDLSGSIWKSDVVNRNY
ncbi:MAG: hypothetical protein ACLP56_21025 [Candidatus Sulfotelmatobacter sp.]